MHVIVFASAKGGVGKTTLAAHVAVAAEQAGDGPIVLVDVDPQGSLADWWNARAAETPAFAAGEAVAGLAGQVEQLRRAGYQLVIIDTPPSVTPQLSAVIELADLVVIPVRPSPHDLRAVGQTVDLVEASGKPFHFVVTHAKDRARLTAQAVAALSEHGAVAPALVADRVDYAGSMIDGRTVLELDARGKSSSEINELWAFIKAKLHGSTKARKTAKKGVTA